jgi:2-polyprenyl-3-methyl-5-hydroxy-6-metoxy-1,4-benzoquinol methylase
MTLQASVAISTHPAIEGNDHLVRPPCLPKPQANQHRAPLPNPTPSQTDPTQRMYDLRVHNISDVDELDVRMVVNVADVCLVLALANSWNKESKAISISSFTGSRLTDVVALHIDLDSEVEELAIELGLTSVPSCAVYIGGKVFRILLSATNTSIQSAITDACVQTDNWVTEDQREMVSKAYAETAKDTQGGCCVSVDSTLMGYSAEDLLKAGSAVLGLGCGNPLSFASLQPGETVVDLGSGAGIDCFIAGSQVSGSGRVIGVDMTPEMISAARKNAKDGNHNNVEFRLGEIEHLPIGDSVVDCVISNCVINLSPNKQQVIDDIFRVLKSGGRVAISDVVARPGVTLPPHLQTAKALAC